MLLLLYASKAAHYPSISSYEEAGKWCLSNLEEFVKYKESPPVLNSFVSFASHAKNPLKFMSILIHHESPIGSLLTRIPISFFLFFSPSMLSFSIGRIAKQRD